MNRWLQQHFTPSQLSKIYIGAAVVAIFFGSWIIMEMMEPGPRERVKREKPTNIVTEASTRQMGLDAVNDKATQAAKGVEELRQELELARKENEELKDQLVASTTLAEAVAKSEKNLAKLEKKMAEEKANQQEQIERAVAKALENAEVERILGSGDKNIQRKSLPSVNPERRPVKNTGFSYGNGSNTQTSSNEGYGNSSSNARSTQTNADARVGNLFAVIESSEPTPSEEEVSPIYVPKGSILTGVLITGLDAPTASAASQSPIPVLVRLKKEAILPNYATVQEVRECFAILAGYGDLSSERAFLRGESITCVREDGRIIEANFKSFAVGEDGKNGLKGTLVSRNSTVLANAMMAGFASGLSSMFNVNPVASISTSPDGQQKYQEVFSPEALQGGAAKGASDAMNKLADYYLKLADAIHPVIEIGGGRVVDMVVTEGARL